MNEAQARVEEALRRLPVLPGQEDKIPAAAQRIALSHFFGRVNELPRARRKGARKAEIGKLADKAADLGAFILSLHRDTLDAMGPHLTAGPHPLALVDDINKLIDACALALSDLAKVEDAPRRRGRPGGTEEHGAAAATRAAASVYKALTGQEATVATNYDTGMAYGPFRAFLDEVFDALGIEASAEHRARTNRRKT